MHRIEQKRLMIVMIVIDGKIIFITAIVVYCMDLQESAQLGCLESSKIVLWL